MIYLIENGLLRADEGPLEGLLGTISQSHRVADVEELALVVDIGVISVNFVFTAESVDWNSAILGN